MRYANRRDETQAEIVSALERIGCSVADMSRVGGGAPDLVVARNGRTVLLECKSRSGKLRTEQELFRALWRGEIYTVRTVDEAIGVMIGE